MLIVVLIDKGSSSTKVLQCFETCQEIIAYFNKVKF